MFFQKIGEGFVGQLLERRHFVLREKVENVPGLIVKLYALARHFTSAWKSECAAACRPRGLR